MSEKDPENPEKYGKDPASFEKLNNYSNHKNYAKGLVDIALIVANAGQLVRFAINFCSPYFGRYVYFCWIYSAFLLIFVLFWVQICLPLPSCVDS